jgi:hypothetical protein
MKTFSAPVNITFERGHYYFFFIKVDLRMNTNMGSVNKYTALPTSSVSQGKTIRHTKIAKMNRIIVRLIEVGKLASFKEIVGNVPTDNAPHITKNIIVCTV